MELPNYRYFRASTPGEVDGFLDEFFRLKSAHLGALGLKNAFDQPGVKPFVREACHRGDSEGPAESSGYSRVHRWRAAGDDCAAGGFEPRREA